MFHGYYRYKEKKRKIHRCKSGQFFWVQKIFCLNFTKYPLKNFHATNFLPKNYISLSVGPLYLYHVAIDLKKICTWNLVFNTLATGVWYTRTLKCHISTIFVPLCNSITCQAIELGSFHLKLKKLGGFVFFVGDVRIEIGFRPFWTRSPSPMALTTRGNFFTQVFIEN